VAGFSALVLRRVAYLRHMPMSGYFEQAMGANVSDDAILSNPDHYRLRDVGFELIADHSASTSYSHAGDIFSVLAGFFAMFPIALGVLARRRPATRPVFLISICIRWLRYLSVVALLRPVFYLFTSMPAPDLKCVTHNETVWKPSGLGEVFQISGLFGQGCGDLLYSGHVSSSITSLMILFHYAEPTYGRRLRPLLRTYYFVVVALVAVDCYFILAVRHHYTVDIVSALIITYFVWKQFGSWMTHDFQPVQVLNSQRCCSLLYPIELCSRTGDDASARERELDFDDMNARDQWLALEKIMAATPREGHFGAAFVIAVVIAGVVVCISYMVQIAQS